MFFAATPPKHTAGVACRKTLPKNDLSDAECQLRLKRWLVAGLDDAGWPKGKQRTHHLSLGGQRLAHYSTGLSEAELDAKAGARPDHS